MQNKDHQTKNVLLAIAAFVWWGLAPLFFIMLNGVDALEIMSHRIIWSLLTIIPAMWLLNKKNKILEIIKTPKLFFGLIITGFLIGINWLVYVWAISNGQVLETSLGYFINPLISVALGIVFLGEKLNNRKYIALLLVVLAVANQILQHGSLPWVSLSLAFSFGFYGLIRKKLHVDSFNGLLMEIIITLPFATAFLIWKYNIGENAFFSFQWQINSLLILSGIITIVPMALFAASVKGIKLSTMGFIQYLAPSITFLLAVFVFHEPLGSGQIVSFSLIWLALVFISWDALKGLR
ncbi:MAG: EamA family transporter RarD [Gammaproteobacteria bacterium]|nr:EamA family transporter RarD [Gammaproteobacteria bacterium]